MRARRSFFKVGIYPKSWGNTEWPWLLDHNNALYLSAKYRPCGERKAAEFTTPIAAREFFHHWSKKRDYYLEVVEYKRFIDIPDPKLPPDHPRAILKTIRANEHGNVWHTASCWFDGDDVRTLWHRDTLKKHRTLLLPYGIDIFKVPEYYCEPPPSLDDDVWHLEKPTLVRVK